MEESSSARIYLLMINLSKHIIWLVSESNIRIAITKVKMVIQRYLLDYCYRNIFISLYCDNLLIIDSFFLCVTLMWAFGFHCCFQNCSAPIRCQLKQWQKSLLQKIRDFYELLTSTTTVKASLRLRGLIWKKEKCLPPTSSITQEQSQTYTMVVRLVEKT